MARIEVSEADLLAALSESQRPGPESARSVADMAEATGVSVGMVRKALQRLQRDGRLTVHLARRPSIAGAFRAVPVYTITKKKR